MVSRRVKQSEDPQTWRDFVPGFIPLPRMITRAEVLAAFAEARVPLTERTLRYWETEGALPRPIRQQHEGRVQAMYPHWFPLLVATVGARRESGESVASIAADMPRLVSGHALMLWAAENNYFLLENIQPSLLPELRQLAERFSKPDRPVAQGIIYLADAEHRAITALWWRPDDGLVSVGNEEGIPSDTLSDGGVSGVPSDSD